MQIQDKRMGPFIAVAGASLVFGIFIGRISAPKSTPAKAQAQVRASSKLKNDKKQTKHRIEKPASFVNSEPGSGQTFNSLFNKVTEHDIEQMARAAASSPDDARLQVILVEWVKKDPWAALTFAHSMSRKDLLYDAVQQMGQTQSADALRWIQTNVNKVGDRNNLTVAVYKGMAQVDPAGTVADIEQMTPGSMRNEMLSIAMDEWIQKDVNAVFDWLDTTESNQQSLTIYSSAVGRFIERSPKQATSIITAMEPCEEKVSFASQLACKLAQKDIQTALDWAQGLDPRSKKYAESSIISTWASGDDVVNAFHYIMENSDAPEYQDLFSTVAIQLSNQNPDELLAAMPTMTQESQMIAAEQLTRVYAQESLAQCDQWIESLECGPVKDVAIKRVLDIYRQQDVIHAFDLSQTLSDEFDRVQQARHIMTTWVRLDPIAAEQALRESSILTRDQKEEISIIFF